MQGNIAKLTLGYNLAWVEPLSLYKLARSGRGERTSQVTQAQLEPWMAHMTLSRTLTSFLLKYIQQFFTYFKILKTGI